MTWLPESIGFFNCCNYCFLQLPVSWMFYKLTWKVEMKFPFIKGCQWLQIFVLITTAFTEQ